MVQRRKSNVVLGVCVGAVVAGIVLAYLMLATCLEGCAPTQGDLDDAAGVETQESPQPETPEPPEEVIAEPEVVEVRPDDVLLELRRDLSEPWGAVGDGRMFDTADGILRLSKRLGTDPLIMAQEVADLMETTVLLQPQFLVQERQGGLPRAMDVAWDIYRATNEVSGIQCPELSDEHETFETDDSQVPRVNPYIILAMGYRESRLALKTERGYMERRVGAQVTKVTDCLYCTGARGERGMFQFMPRGALERRFMGTCSPFDRWCSTQAAVRALATIRCSCIKRFGEQCTVDAYVAGYGLTRLITPDSARHSKGPRRAREFLCSVYEDCDSVWPRDDDDAFALEL